MGQGRFGHDRILSGVIMCHVVGNNGVFPERGSRGPCVGFWGTGSIWQRMWYFCAKSLWIKGVFYHGLCVIIYAGRIVPYWTILHIPWYDEVKAELKLCFTQVNAHFLLPSRMWRNDMNCKYLFMLLLKILARKGLRIIIGFHYLLFLNIVMPQVVEFLPYGKWGPICTRCSMP